MIPAPFEYFRPGTVAEAADLLARHGEDAKILAGGHSLVPSMKLRLAQPNVVIDIGRIPDLRSVREVRGKIVIGAMTTHREIEFSSLLGQKCSLLPEVAAQIGDPQVRNRGTIGGSLVHADPAADWPAAILALDAEMVVASRNGERKIPANAFFVDLFESALRPEEILVAIRVPVTSGNVAYAKTVQKASGFALAGVAVVVERGGRGVRIGVSGVAARPYRAVAVEKALKGKRLTAQNISNAVARATDGVEALNDIHASEEYRKQLAVVNTQRALELAASRS